jgi:hypothetical protein
MTFGSPATIPDSIPQLSIPLTILKNPEKNLKNIFRKYSDQDQQKCFFSTK